MRRLLVLALVLAGCTRGSSLLFSHDTQQRVQLSFLLDDMADVKEKLDHPPPVRRMGAPSAGSVYRNPRTGRISTRVLFPGGHLKLVGMPEKARDEVVLAFRAVATLDESCLVRLYRDGERVPTGEQLRRSNHELLVSLSIGELGPSTRFSGTACGQQFQIDQAGRDTIASFADRFHERLDELSAPTVASAR